MLKIYVADIFNGWQKLVTLDSKSITLKQLAMDINVAHELSVQVNTSMGKWWNKLVYTEQYGIILETERYKLPFIKSNKEVKINTNGIVSLSLYSTVWTLKTSQRKVNDKIYAGSLAAYISSLDTTLNFNFVSSDFTIKYDAGMKSNMDILNELIKQYNLCFVEVGINTQNYPEIVIGLKEDVASYVGVAYGQRTKVSNFVDINELTINNIERVLDYNYITHIYPYIDSSSGSSQSTRQSLRAGDVVIQAGFPLEYDSIRQKNYVVNTALYEKTGVAKYDDLAVSMSTFTNSKFYSETVQENLTAAEVKQNLYLAAIDKLRSTTAKEQYELSFIYKRLFLPCTRVKINYKTDSILLDSSSTTVFEMNDTQNYYLRSLRYDEKDLNAFYG